MKLTSRIKLFVADFYITEVLIMPFPHAAGSIRALRDKDGSPYPKPVQNVFMHHQNTTWNPYIPFATAEARETVALAPQHRFGKKIVDDWIKSFLWKIESFQSVDQMWKLIDSLSDALGPQSWKSQSLLVVEDEKEVKYPYYYRNPLDCVRLLLRHLPFKKDLVWSPVRRFSDARYAERLYLDLHTGDYW
jgi:hypothetical protein